MGRFAKYINLSFFGYIVLANLIAGCGSEQNPNASVRDLEKFKDLIQKRFDDLQAMQKKQIELLDSLATEQQAMKSMVPSNSLKDIAEIVKKLGDSSKRPKGKEEIEKERKNLQSIFSRLHPLAAPVVMADISKANWVLESLFVLDQYKSIPDESLEEAEELLETIIERYSFNDFSDVKNDLDSLLKNIRKKNLAYTKLAIIEKATLALSKGQDLETAYVNLEKYEEEDKIRELRKKIRAKVLENSLADQIAKIANQFEKTMSIKDSKIQINSLANIVENLAKIQVDLAIEEDWVGISNEQVLKVKDLTSKCDKEIQILSNKKEKEKEKEYLAKMKNYQKWALEQIDEFDGKQGWNYDNTLPWVNSQLAGFKESKDKTQFEVAFYISPELPGLIEKILNIDLSETKKNMILSKEKKNEIFTIGYTTAIGWKRGLNTEIAYRIHRDAMVKFLLPIQSNLLEPPIHERFLRAYDKGQKKLEGRDEDKLFVAEQTLKVQKKSLNDFIK